MSGTIADQLRNLGLAPAEPVQQATAPKNLAERLKAFDWTWEYADPFLSKARREEKRLKALLKEQGCPFPWEALRNWANNWILEDFEEAGPGQFFRKGHERGSYASLPRKELITRDKHAEISAWLAEH